MDAATSASAELQPEPEPDPEPAAGGEGSGEGRGEGEELFCSKHAEWAALQWLEAFLPGGSQIACAKAEMERKGLTSRSLHYAEVNLNFFALLLLRAQARFFPGFGKGTFVDIGSGTGKCGIAAGLTLPWARCVGIEIMEDMHEQSILLLEKWKEAAAGPGFLTEVAERGAELITACGDATAPEEEVAGWLGEAEVVFMNSLVFEAALMRAMGTALARMLKPGAIVMTTQLLPNDDCFELIGDSDDCFPDVFDTAALTEPTVFIQRRLP